MVKLDKVNARRVAFYIEKHSRKFIRDTMMYDPRPFDMEHCTRGVTDLVRAAGWTTDLSVTTEVVDAMYEFRCRIGIVPNGATEFIWIDHTATRTPEFVRWLKTPVWRCPWQ